MLHRQFKSWLLHIFICFLLIFWIRIFYWPLGPHHLDCFGVCPFLGTTLWSTNAGVRCFKCSWTWRFSYQWVHVCGTFSASRISFLPQSWLFFLPSFFFLWENGVDWANKMYKNFDGVVVLSVSSFLSRLLQFMN